MAPQLNWPLDRRNELQQLLSLITETTSINKGTQAIDRIQNCISIAEKLTKTDLDTPRQAFTQFLVEEATKKQKIVEAALALIKVYLDNVDTHPCDTQNNQAKLNQSIPEVKTLYSVIEKETGLKITKDLTLTT
jgi:hypothetical protein